MSKCIWNNFNNSKPSDFTLVTVYFSDGIATGSDTIGGMWIDQPKFWDGEHARPTLWTILGDETEELIKPFKIEE